MTQASLGIPVVDLVIIVVYMVGILADRHPVDPWPGAHSQRLLPGRPVPSLGDGRPAIFAANISTIHLVGLAASGYSKVWSGATSNGWRPSPSILLGLVFAPFYFRSRISTLPEFLESATAPGLRIMLAFMAILAALFIHIGMSLYAGAAVFRQFFGIDVMTSIVIISVVTGDLHHPGRTQSGGRDGDHPGRDTDPRRGRRYGLRRPRPARPRYPYAGGLQGGRQARSAPHAADPQRGRAQLVRDLPRLPYPRGLVLVHRPDDRPAGPRLPDGEGRPVWGALRRAAQDPARLHPRPPRRSRLCPVPRRHRGGQQPDPARAARPASSRPGSRGSSPPDFWRPS